MTGGEAVEGRTGRATRRPGLSEHLAAAQARFDARDFEAARQRLTWAREDVPRAAPERLRLSSLSPVRRLAPAGDPLSAALASVQAEPDAVRGWIALALQAVAAGRRRLAGIAMDEAAALRPDEARLLWEAARFHVASGDVAAALGAAEALARRYPQAAQAHQFQGSVLKRASRFDDAIASFRRALRLGGGPAPGTIRVNLALCLMQIDDAAAARALLVDMLSGEADAAEWPAVIEALSRLPRDMLDEDVRGRIAARAATLDATAIGPFTRARLALAVGDEDAAFADLRRGKAALADTRAAERAAWQETLAPAIASLRDWEPSAPPSPLPGSATPIFLIGPSRSGKSTIEALLADTGHVVRGQEGFRPRSAMAHGRAVQAGAETPRLSETCFFSDRAVADAGATAIALSSPRILDAVPALADSFAWGVFILCHRDRAETRADIFARDYRHGNAYSDDLDSIDTYLAHMSAALDVIAGKIPDRCLRVGYEDLVAAPDATLVRICAFAGLPRPPEGLGVSLAGRRTDHPLSRHVSDLRNGHGI